jgi:hypothetical protein
MQLEAEGLLTYCISRKLVRPSGLEPPTPTMSRCNQWIDNPSLNACIIVYFLIKHILMP